MLPVCSGVSTVMASLAGVMGLSSSMSIIINGASSGLLSIRNKEHQVKVMHSDEVHVCMQFGRHSYLHIQF